MSANQNFPSTTLQAWRRELGSITPGGAGARDVIPDGRGLSSVDTADQTRLAMQLHIQKAQYTAATMSLPLARFAQ